MSEVGSLESRDGNAIIKIDNPPVNALSVDVRRGLSEVVKYAVDDPKIQAVVIACAGLRSHVSAWLAVS